jgi:hypothetical protein
MLAFLQLNGYVDARIQMGHGLIDLERNAANGRLVSRKMGIRAINEAR